MSLVIARDLHLAFGPKVLLQGASFSIGPRDRVGLVGANGTGKSTLLRILAGQVHPDSGTLSFRRGMRIGYLPQDLVAAPEGTLLESVLAAVPGRERIEEQLAATQQALAAATTEEEQLELSTKLTDLHHELEHFEEHYGRHRAERILEGLGFDRSRFHQPAAALSGGWRMRAALAALLLQDPDLLLLDEPTNHLDIPTLTWFDAFLRKSRKALVLICHDRDFLNRQIDRVISLEVEGLRCYAGNYDRYRALRAEEAAVLEARARKIEAQRAHLQSFVDRFRAKKDKAKQAQSRLKQIEKLEKVQILQERETIHLRFPEVPRSGREVLRAEGLRKAFGDHVVYDGASFRVDRGQRIAVVAPNGAGKTTLLKMIAGELHPDAGAIEFGQNVILGYYAQHHADMLDPSKTIFEFAREMAPARSDQEIRSVLGALMFGEDEIDKRIGVLSGGERARVALARLLLRPANLLVMDEPTNHLDLDSTERLLRALQEFDGTLLFVSHNRAFINGLATHVWEVKDRTIDVHHGNLDDWLARQQPMNVDAERFEPRQTRMLSPKERRRLEAEERQRRGALTRPIKEEIARLEARIEELEAKVAEHERQLADPALYEDFARAKEISDAHRVGKEELEALYAQWEDAQERLAAAEAQFATG